MQKYLLNAIVVSLFVLVSGCQSGPGSTMFTPYPTNPTSPPGMTLAQSVQDALMRNGDPVIAQVRVETNQNMVRLSGYVKKIRQSDTAEQIARQVPGVQNVQNNLIVRQ